MENLVFTLIERGFGWNLIRSLFATLDSVAFWIFAKVMGLMFDIANFTAEANLSDFLEPLQNRVYVILSIYMLFKVTVSLISYVVNPDAMTDKNQGVGKLVQRIIIAMVMLIFFPFAFDTANELQANIIEDGTIARLVLGTSDSTIDSPEGMGTEIAFSIYNGTFIYDAETKDAVSEGDLAEPTVESLAEVVNNEGADRSTYKYTYIPLLGFALGIMLTIITLSMCIDVAIRAFKLIILQLVAPIPILSYIDPKASKDGPFSKWLKMVVSVWADLFVRLFIIYFVVLAIEKLLTNGGALADAANPFVFIALIIGLLFFAKDAPKFIFDSLGIKAPERGLFAGIGNIMAAGAIGAGAISGGIAAGSAAGLAAAANGKKPNVFRNVGAGLFGAAGGIATGIGAAAKAKDHNARAVMEAMSKRNDAAIAAGAAGSTALGRAQSTMSRLLTGQTSAMKVERSISAMQAQKDALSNVKSRMSGEMPKQNWTKGSLGLATDNFGNSIGDVNYKDFMARMNAAKTSGQDYVDFYDTSGQALQISMVDAERQWGFLLKNNEDDYIQHAITDGDAHYDAQTAELASIAADTGVTVTNRASINDTIDSLSVQITRAKAANETNKQNDRFAGKK